MLVLLKTIASPSLFPALLTVDSVLSINIVSTVYNSQDMEAT